MTHNDARTIGADMLDVGDVVRIAPIDDDLDIEPGDYSDAEVIGVEHDDKPSVVVTFDTIEGVIDCYYDEGNCPTFTTPTRQEHTP